MNPSEVKWVVATLRDERMQLFWDEVQALWNEANKRLRVERSIIRLNEMEVLERVRLIPDRIEKKLEENS